MDNSIPVSSTEPWAEKEWSPLQAEWGELRGPRWAEQTIRSIALAPASRRAALVAKWDAIARRPRGR